MGLMIPTPDSLSEDMQVTFASLQAWSGKVDGAGKWTDVTFSAMNFASTVGVWTVEVFDQRLFRYAVNQDVMSLQMAVRNTTTNGTIGNQLKLTIPGGYRSRFVDQVGFVHWSTTALGGAIGVALTTSLTDQISLYRAELGATTFPAGVTNDFNVIVAMTFAVYHQ